MPMTTHPPASRALPGTCLCLHTLPLSPGSPGHVFLTPFFPVLQSKCPSAHLLSALTHGAAAWPESHPLPTSPCLSFPRCLFKVQTRGGPCGPLHDIGPPQVALSPALTWSLRELVPPFESLMSPSLATWTSFLGSDTINRCSVKTTAFVCPLLMGLHIHYPLSEYPLPSLAPSSPFPGFWVPPPHCHHKGVWVPRSRQ